MADEDLPHSEASSGASFKNFWRLKDKISGTGVKFTPNVTNPDEIKDQNPTDAITQKQHRRAQVRKAQIEHRQRKKNYVKHLEQDIIQLREQIAVAEAERNLIWEENTAIKDTLSRAQVPSAIESNRLSTNFLLPAASPDFLSSQAFGWPSSDSSICTQVSVDFDALMQADCLRINRAESFGDRYNQQPIREFSQLTGNTNHHDAQPLQTDVSSTLPEHPSSTFQSMAPSQSDIAVNFILALEYPCRTHFRHVPSTTTAFDPKAPATGHELMASTLVYSHATYTPILKEETQTPVQDYRLTSKTWTAPDLPLSKLYAMSLSLPKEDFEITPVQAWFLLTEKYQVEWLLKEGRLEKLKAELRDLVKCWDFGAVINIALFWEVVQTTLGS